MRQNKMLKFANSRNTIDEDFFLTAQQLRVTLEPDNRLAGQDGESCERQYRRKLRSISVSIQPLDDDFQPCGEVFWVVSRDISLTGMGLISHDPFSHKYVRLGLMEQAVTTIAKVCHNTPIGEKYPLFLVGLKFQGKLLDPNGNVKSNDSY